MKLETLDILGTPLDIYDGPIGIMCGGGADSSILLFLLMKYSKGPIHIFTECSITEQRKPAFITIRVIETCIQLTNNLNITQHNIYTNNGNLPNLIGNTKQWIIPNYLNKMYIAVTSTPSQSVLDTFKHKYEPLCPAVQRTPDVEKSIMIKKAYAPFRNLHKQQIADMFNAYNLIEDLYSITRSCVWTPNDNAPDPGFGHCNNCWWCEERTWGFKKYVK